jgi:hypothetical protein
VKLCKQIAEQIILLERQDAQCFALLEDGDELIERVIAAIAPLQAVKDASAPIRALLARTWVAWVSDCGDRFEPRPRGVNAAELENLILRLALRLFGDGFGACRAAGWHSNHQRQRVLGCLSRY